MSFIPTNPYYAWVYLKIGIFEATPIPPEHLISMEILIGSGAGTVLQDVGNGEKRINYTAKKEAQGNTNLCTSAKVVLFDETALRVEAQIILGQSVVQLCYGYVNGPRSPIYNLYVDNYTTNFSRTGSATLTLSLVPNAMLALKKDASISYEGLTLNKIVEAIREENHWEAGDIADIDDVPETIYVRDPEDPDKYNKVERPKIFIRMNQNPIEFLQNEIAPFCTTGGGKYGDFRLWFDGASNSNSNMITGSPLSDIANAVSDYFKGYMTGITDPLMKELNKALGEVLSWAAESLSKVQELISTVGDIVSKSMSKLTSSLGSLQSVAKQAITSLLSGGLTGLTQSLTTSLVNAGINLVKGAVGGLLDKVTGGLMNKIGSLTGLVGTVENILSGDIGGAIGGLINGGGLSGLSATIAKGLAGGLAGGLGGALTKLNELTNLSFINLDSMNKFKNSSKIARLMNKSLSMSGSVMNFRPIIMEMDNQEVSSNYFFDVGSTGGSQGESSVLDFNYTQPGAGAGILHGEMAKDGILATIDMTGGIALSTADSAELVEANDVKGAENLQAGTDPGGGVFCLALSSESPESLEALSATFFSLYRRTHAGQAQMKIFGDPSIKLYEKCQVTVMTKKGQLHYSSGYYFICKKTDTIQGGVFTTTLELFRHPEDKDDAEVLMKGKTTKGVSENASIDNSGDAPIDSNSGGNTNTTPSGVDDTNVRWEEDLWGNRTVSN